MPTQLFNNPSLLQMYLEDDEKVIFALVCRRNSSTMSHVLRRAVLRYISKNRNLISQEDLARLRCDTPYLRSLLSE